VVGHLQSSEAALVETAVLGALPPCHINLQNLVDYNLRPGAGLHLQPLVHDCTGYWESLCFVCIMPDYTVDVGCMEWLVSDCIDLMMADFVEMGMIEGYPIHSPPIKRDAVVGLEVVKGKMSTL
jgi:hypothetical protein